MTNQSVIANKRPSDLAARVEVLEAQALALRILLHAIVRNANDSARTLAMATRDIHAWASRPTVAAHSPLARGAREIALQMIADLEDETLHAHTVAGNAMN